MGRYAEARQIYCRLIKVCSNLGLLSEEYDTSNARLVGNFPQAFSHVGLVNSARNLSQQQGAAHHRSNQ